VVGQSSLHETPAAPLAIRERDDGVRLPVVHFLLSDAYAGTGVSRTTIGLANWLTGRGHTVEVTSVLRRAEEPRFPLDSRIGLTVLDDVRERTPQRLILADCSSWLRPNPADAETSLLTDLLLRRRLRPLRGIVVSTRPSLHLAVARWASTELTTIGFEPLGFDARFSRAKQAKALRAAIPRLDRYVVSTFGDAAAYRNAMPECAARIGVIRHGRVTAWEELLRDAAAEGPHVPR
jgi:hypothetical protein